jgi:hypothetical protein
MKYIIISSPDGGDEVNAIPIQFKHFFNWLVLDIPVDEENASPRRRS